MLKSYLTVVLLLILSACAAQPVSKTKLMTAPHFWQRSEASSAIYQRGPKAQQMLNRDIARCVTELRELERLGALRKAIPGNTPNDSLSDWDTPERDGYLRTENLEYHDFETCMIAKGWERIEHVPYNVAEEGRKNYIEAIIGERYQSKTREHDSFMSKPAGDFDNLND